MKKFITLFTALFVCACASHQASWQPAPSTEEGVDMYYWDTSTSDPDNQNLKTTRMLAHGSSFGPSMVFDVTFNCTSQDPSIRLNQIEVYSEEFAKGHLLGQMMEQPDRWESLQYFGQDFQYVYQHICN